MGHMISVQLKVEHPSLKKKSVMLQSLNLCEYQLVATSRNFTPDLM